MALPPQLRARASQLYPSSVNCTYRTYRAIRQVETPSAYVRRMHELHTGRFHRRQRLKRARGQGIETSPVRRQRLHRPPRRSGDHHAAIAPQRTQRLPSRSSKGTGRTHGPKAACRNRCAGWCRGAVRHWRRQARSPTTASRRCRAGHHSNPPCREIQGAKKSAGQKPTPHPPQHPLWSKTSLLEKHRQTPLEFLIRRGSKIIASPIQLRTTQRGLSAAPPAPRSARSRRTARSRRCDRRCRWRRTPR
jgi:hypothetical protein